MSINIIDLFAGPGGSDQGLAQLGRRDVIGIEWDNDACITAETAGHERICSDVSLLDPHEFQQWGTGLIASPPCQGFSLAGQGRGRADTDAILTALPKVAAGMSIQDAAAGLTITDHRSLLVLEPLRWATALAPDWFAWEQVPAVLPLWEACEGALHEQGYTSWFGLVNAQDFGVPQVRKRAVILGRRGGPLVTAPVPTRAGYPVTMYEALGWGMIDRPYPTLACSRTSGGGPDREKVGGSGARKALYAERDAGRWIHGGGCCCADPTTCGIPGTAGAPFAEPAERPLGAKRHDGGIRLSLAEAARLQTFPADYPWHGTATARFQQIGNAVPPLLGEALLRHLGVDTEPPTTFRSYQR